MVEVKKFLEGSQISAELRSLMDSAETIKIAVAFLKEGGFKEIKNSLKQALGNKGNVEFIVGACPVYHITDPQVLYELKRMEKEHSRLKLGLFHGVEFHPKLFIFAKQNIVRVLLGSSNLTSGGTGNNIEANVLVEGTNREPLIREIQVFYDNVIFGSSCKLTDEYIRYYKKIFEISKRSTRKTGIYPLPKPPMMSTPKSWKNYPHPYRVLNSEEREELRRRIAETGSNNWEPIYCITFAKEYKCSAYQIRGTKARVLHSSSWNSINKGGSAVDKRKIAVLWSTDPGDHIKLHQKHLAARKSTLWGVEFRVNPRQYRFPLTGYLYVNGDCVKYKVTIASIETYRDKRKSKEPDLRPDAYRNQSHRTFLKLTKIVSLKRPQKVSYFTKLDGKPAKGGQSLRNHIRIRDPLLS